MSLKKPVEPRPSKFIKRSSDIVLESENNSIIIVGTDRAANGLCSHNTGYGNADNSSGGAGAGSIHIIAGRKRSDPDFTKDDAFVHISQKTDADVNLGSTAFGSNAQAQPAIIAKSTNLRLTFKDNGSIKIFLDGSDNKFILADKNKIELHHGENILIMTGNTVGISGAKNVEIDASNEIIVGKLGQALNDLVSIFTTNAANIGYPGNLGAPVPLAPPVLSLLNDWKVRWISPTRKGINQKATSVF